MLDLQRVATPEAFGPGAEHPWLAVDLAGAGPEALVEWLPTLPCPVIGVGAPLEGRRLASACDVIVEEPGALGAIAATIEAAPLAAMTFVQLLRMVERLPDDAALTAKSLAYATLQSGPEFRRWLNAEDRPAAAPEPGPAVKVAREGDQLDLILNRPASRNAMSNAMREDLVEALDLAALDDSLTHVTIGGAGRCFSVGGALNEFGLTPDPATAHWARSVRSPARSALRCAAKLHARVHGACIGAGLELPAFARHVIASPSAFFQLPELRMGLLPGSGGCVSLSRRIGRQRTALMGLSGRRIGAATALAWGLVDAIEQA